MKGRAIFVEFSLLASSTLVLQIANLGVQLAVARLVGPAAFGDWSLLLLAIAYVSYFQLGTLNAMNRDLPLFRGKGDESRGGAVRDVALSTVVLASIPGGVVLALLPATVFSPEMPPIARIAGGVYVLANGLWSYTTILLQSSQRFREFSAAQILLAVLTISLTLPAGAKWGIAGALFGQCAALGIGCVVAWIVLRLNAMPCLDVGEWWRMVRVGFPIMIVGLGYVLLTTTDRWVVGMLLGPSAVGQYSFVARFVAVGVMLASLVANQVYPRMAESWGRYANKGMLLAMVRQQSIASAAIALAGAIVLWLLLPPLVRALWPSFAPSLSALPLLLVTMLVLPQCAVYGVLLNVLDRQWGYLGIQALAIGVSVLANFWLTAKLHSIVGAALASAIVSVGYLAALAWLARALLRGNGAGEINLVARA